MSVSHKKSFFAGIAIVAFIFAAAAQLASADAPTYGPDTLTATPVSSSEIDLSWTWTTTSYTTVTGYMIEREFPVGAGFTTIVSNTNNTATTYKDTGLSPNTAYSYRVSAANSSGTGPAYPPPGANPVFTTTLGATAYVPPPDPPKNLIATAASGSEIDLSWTAAKSDSLITGYEIERDFSGGFTVIVPNTNSAATSYADANLSPNVTYSYRVSAINASGASSPSAVARAITPVPPGAPISAKATAGDGQALVSWGPAYASAGGVTGYIVSGTPNGSANVSSSTLNAIITGLTNGIGYSFSVNAFNLGGKGPAIITNTVIPSTSTPALPPSSSSPQVAATPSVPGQSLQDQLNTLMSALQALQSQAAQKGISLPQSASNNLAPTFVFVLQAQKGWHGKTVGELQKRLKKEGFYSGEITSYFGSITKAALQAYQRAHGIAPTGILGPLTRASLNGN